MSILIKGMAMPKGCNDCNFQCFAKWGGDSSYANEIATKCLATDKFVFPSDSERDENCPLIEVPPHGLIDKQMLLRNIADNQFAHSSVGHEEDYAFWGKVWDYINDAPTIIESEGADEL